MRTRIGKYIYDCKEDEKIDVLYNEITPEGEIEYLIMVFIKRGTQVFSQGDIMNPDYIEIQGNAIGIFNESIAIM
jgi:hypothetical protein